MAEEKTQNTADAPKIDLPSDYTNEQDFLADVRRWFQDDLDFDRLNREAAIEDAKFVAGDQWDDSVKSRRLRAKKPVLTFNRLVAFVGQIVGNRRNNETAIKVTPVQNGTREIALARQGLIRDIEQRSHADRAYDLALQNCVIQGIGSFAIRVDYANDDVFEQDIFIDSHKNAMAVVWDRTLVDPSGADAGHVFVVETIPRKAFKAQYPWADNAEDLSLDEEIVTANSENWFTADDVRVVMFWRMRTRPRTLALMQTGVTRDITNDTSSETMDAIAVNPATGKKYIRKVQKPYCEGYKLCGTKLLEGPVVYDIPRVPVFRVPGWEINIGEAVTRFGMIRHMKDPQRLHNYWRSAIAEKLALAPRARWSASAESVAGREKAWRNAHLSDDPLLVWNGESGQPPVFTPPAQLEAALVQEAGMTVQDLRDISNLHEASLGQTSNEVSGKGILARQRVGELGTVIYFDNLRMAQEEAGKVINALIPSIYDTARTIRVLGEDGKEAFHRINDPNEPNALNIGQGRYDITSTTGPSYTTKRVEAQESMLTVFNAAPQTMAIAADLFVRNMDWPGADEFERRLRKMIPPNALDPRDMSPEEAEAMKAQQAQQEQQQAVQMQLQLRGANAEVAEKEAKAALADAQAKLAEAEADAVEAKAQLARAQALKALEEAQALDIDNSLAMTDMSGIENMIAHGLAHETMEANQPDGGQEETASATSPQQSENDA